METNLSNSLSNYRVYVQLQTNKAGKEKGREIGKEIKSKGTMLRIGEFR